MSGAYSPKEARGGIWVVLEERDGVLEGVSKELLGKARDLALAHDERVTGLLLGHAARAAAKEATSVGADDVLFADHPLLAGYRTDPHADAAAEAILEGKPSIVLFGATANGRDLAGRLAVRLRTGLTADCTDLTIEKSADGPLLNGEVTGFGGGIAAVIVCKERRPQMATVRPGVFAVPAKPGKVNESRIKAIKVNIRPERIRTEVVERSKDGPGVDMTRAEYLVVGGRGVGGDFGMVEKLASRLGGEVGATRVAVDEGWIGKDRMIGQTGYSARPKIAIACGVSGALQFMVGIQHADVIVAINNDPEAPIFEQADYGIAGDVKQVLPALLKALG